MKRVFSFILIFALIASMIFSVSAADSTTGSTNLPFMNSALIVMIAILVILVIACIFVTILFAKKKLTSTSNKILLIALYVVTAFVIIGIVMCAFKYRDIDNPQLNSSGVSSDGQSHSSSQHENNTSSQTQSESITESESVTSSQTETNQNTQITDFTPKYISSTNPKKWNVKWDILVNKKIVSKFNRKDKISFGDASTYTDLEGITTFRGNNYRNGATYGTATITNKTITTKWKKGISALNGWTGCGWTGQPLVVRWDDETKAIMNLYDSKKSKEGLVEVIYATLDGYVYFYDMDDGSYTRDPIFLGMNFKGAGSLDPRGYPLLYVGSGDKLDGKSPKMYIVSLINGKILHNQNGYDTSTKRWWFAFDSAPLVHAESDTLIWPGESGIIYTIKLNTKFNREKGKISVDPETVVKTRYSTKSSKTLGFESSCIAVDKYLYVGDNSGMLFCIDMNTMKLVWAQHTKDDINATPVFEWGKDGKGYLYTATSMQYAKGNSYIYKLDATTGEILWKKTYGDIVYDYNVSGGVLSSPLLGKPGTEMEGIIVYHIGRTPTSYAGILVALDTETGDVIWENKMNNYTWSSPVAVYTDNGDSYIVICDSAGRASLLDALTGKTLDTVSMGANIEASPVVFENTVVVGTRGQRVYALSLG